MAEDSDLEKTEPASPQRLQKAREDGDVPRSRELATCTVLLAAGSGVWMTGDYLVKSMSAMMASGLSLDREQIYDLNVLFARIATDVIQILTAFSPIAALLIIVAVGSPLLIGGWLFSSKALQPNFGRMNPLKGLSNLVSTHALVELGKAVAKAVVVGFVAWLVVSSQMQEMLSLSVEPFNVGVAHVADLLWTSFITIVASLVVIAAIDAPYQMWHYANKLKMTRQEVREESKQSEGDPQIKAKIRAMQREMARRRMMADVPTADVVVTNPTHFAVALKYTEGKMRAPKVVAKGADEIAAKIRELAASSNVPLLEAPPLARALHRHAEIGDEIPQALYTAVAEVLAYVFQLRTYRTAGGIRPEAPQAIDVPAELDPLNPASGDRIG